MFIHLLSQERRHDAVLLRARSLAVLRKEWIQVRRDPFTLRMIILLPMMQLFLFGYAINADPKHLPTGLLVRQPFALRAHPGRGDEQHRLLRCATASVRSRGGAGLARGELLFVINIPPVSTAP